MPLIPDYLDALDHALVNVVDVSKADDLLGGALSSLRALESCDVVLDGLVSPCSEVIPAVQLRDSMSSLFFLHLEALVHGLGLSADISQSYTLKSVLLLNIVVSVATLRINSNDIDFFDILLLVEY